MLVLVWKFDVAFLLRQLKTRIFGRKIPRVILEYEQEKKRKIAYQAKKLNELVGNFNWKNYTVGMPLEFLNYDPRSSSNNCYRVLLIYNPHQMQRMKKIMDNTHCLFAKKALIWTSQDYDPKLTLEQNIDESIVGYSVFMLVKAKS